MPPRRIEDAFNATLKDRLLSSKTVKKPQQQAQWNTRRLISIWFTVMQISSLGSTCQGRQQIFRNLLSVSNDLTIELVTTIPPDSLTNHASLRVVKSGGNGQMTKVLLFCSSSCSVVHVYIFN